MWANGTCVPRAVTRFHRDEVDMSGPRILKNYDYLVELTKRLRIRVEAAESRGHVLLVDGASLVELLEAVRKGSDDFTFDSRSAAARIAMVRSGKDSTIYAPDVMWRPAPN